MEPEVKQLEFVIVDAFGAIVKTGMIQSNSEPIDISSLNKGFYTLRFPSIYQKVGFSKLN